ncbi:MAG: repeat-containing protein [Paenibacillaceae bacterium]|jgi:tetratricopeptide (TPR) repeat protein|nr:repeat-containing protein [Paenibacillaceae bacterium]
MFKQLFASMNGALDDILSRLPASSGKERKDLEDRLSVLKAMSDTCIEEWLLFEEKMGLLSGGDAAGAETVSPKVQPTGSTPKLKAAATVSTGFLAESVKPKAATGSAGLKNKYHLASFSKGQGYYKLSMFKQAVEELERVVGKQPDDLLARMYLAMAYFHCEEYAEAYRHFQIVVPLTDDLKMKAISYNAMGCIQAERQNLDKALELFRLAHSADPDSIEPVLSPAQWDKRN